MVKASSGFRSGTRRKLSKRLRNKYKPEVYLKEFKPKDRILVKQFPQSHKGMPFPRFKGLAGEVIRKTNDSYEVSIFVGNKKKNITAKPEHLELLNIKK